MICDGDKCDDRDDGDSGDRICDVDGDGPSTGGWLDCCSSGLDEWHCCSSGSSELCCCSFGSAVLRGSFVARCSFLYGENLENIRRFNLI